MSFSEFDVNRRTRKGNFLNPIDQLIDWAPIEKAIAPHYAPVSDAAGRPAYPGLLLFKMLLAGIWQGDLSDEAVEDMVNSNLHATLRCWWRAITVMCIGRKNSSHLASGYTVSG
ncbi:MAG: transposase [Nitrosomonas sp.]|nr:transposase [Nitrosomonas sp.]